MGLLFEWDPEKAASNRREHKVSFDEAASVFADPLSVTVFDPLHSDEEDRFVIVGMSNKNRVLVVCFTDRNGRVRIISARVATKRERIDYEEGSEA
jgi:uncharacterized DUF497 family protein